MRTNPWQRVLEIAGETVRPTDFGIWFKPTRLQRTEGAKIVVRVPTVQHYYVLSQRFGELIHSSLPSPYHELEYVIGEI